MIRRLIPLTVATLLLGALNVAHAQTVELAGVKYPPPFVFTTTRDDRVGPQHARKYAARMEELKLPFYYFENTEGGHGEGADLKQRARTQALIMTYLQQRLMD